MKFILDQVPVPPSSNQLYATDWKTGRRFESKESVEYKKRFKAWALERFYYVAKINEALRWEVSDHRKMIKIDSYMVLQSSVLFTKAQKKNERPRRKKMDVSNKGKALYDCLSNMLQIDDSRFLPGVIEPIIRRGELGQYCIIVISIEIMRDEKELLDSLIAKYPNEKFAITQ